MFKFSEEEDKILESLGFKKEEKTDTIIYNFIKDDSCMPIMSVCLTKSSSWLRYKSTSVDLPEENYNMKLFLLDIVHVVGLHHENKGRENLQFDLRCLLGITENN